jgi:hypothetical protein
MPDEQTPKPPRKTADERPYEEAFAGTKKELKQIQEVAAPAESSAEAKAAAKRASETQQ